MTSRFDRLRKAKDALMGAEEAEPGFGEVVREIWEFSGEVGANPVSDAQAIVSELLKERDEARERADEAWEEVAILEKNIKEAEEDPKEAWRRVADLEFDLENRERCFGDVIKKAKEEHDKEIARLQAHMERLVEEIEERNAKIAHYSVEAEKQSGVATRLTRRGLSRETLVVGPGKTEVLAMIPDDVLAPYVECLGYVDPEALKNERVINGQVRKDRDKFRQEFADAQAKLCKLHPQVDRLVIERDHAEANLRETDEVRAKLMHELEQARQTIRQERNAKERAKEQRDEARAIARGAIANERAAHEHPHHHSVIVDGVVYTTSENFI